MKKKKEKKKLGNTVVDEKHLKKHCLISIIDMAG